MELFSEEEGLPDKSGTNKRTEYANRLLKAMTDERRMIGEKTRKNLALSVFEPAAMYCIKEKVMPEFLMHAIAWTNSGKRWGAGTFTYKASELSWKNYIGNKVPVDLPVDVSDLLSPWTIDVWLEVEMLTRMIKGKYKTRGRDEKFLFGTTDPSFDCLAATRLVLSDMNEAVLEQYGQEYLDWCSMCESCRWVLEDFGFDHKQVERFLKERNKR